MAGHSVACCWPTIIWRATRLWIHFEIPVITTMEIKRDRKAWIRGATAQCEPPPKSNHSPRRLVLLGAPGVGKGTQAELLCANLGACHLSTGDIFRAAKALDAGERTPALTVGAGLHAPRRPGAGRDRAGAGGRAAWAACAAKAGSCSTASPAPSPRLRRWTSCWRARSCKLDAVLSYDLPLEQVVARLSGRRTCPSCKAVFHVEARPPKVAGVCDHCGGKLYQREDDRPESIRVRMEAYERSTAPLADFYRQEAAGFHFRRRLAGRHLQTLAACP